MIYDIAWLDEARDELRAIRRRLDEGARWRIARTVARIEDRLAIAPYTQGESRPPHDARIMFELPLSVLYRIERFQGTVVVLHVRYVDRRPRN